MVVARFVLMLMFAIHASGCINSTTLVRLKPDGSGTIEQTLLANATAAKGMAMGGAGAKNTPGAISDAEFKRMAERMGVRPVSLTPAKQGAFEGSKAVFAFDDITKIRLDQDPQVTAANSAIGAQSTSPIKFALLQQGPSSVLTITVDDKATASAADKMQQAPSLDKIDPAVMQMVKSMFEGFRVLIDLEVDGKIIKTNADYVTGSRITLLEVDAAGVFQDEPALKQLQSKIRPGVTFSELRPFLKTIKGVKVNHPTVTIEFR